MILLLLSTYIYFDPFKVIRDYSDYSNSIITLNRDYISTTMFNKNYNKKRYNSFVFGSSRTLAFRPNSWLKYLSDKDRPFMYDAACESIIGIYLKLRYLDSKKVELKNVLIILCRDVSFNLTDYQKGGVFIHHPATTGQDDLSYQFEFFNSYTRPRFLYQFYSPLIYDAFKIHMPGYIEYHKVSYDTVTNLTMLSELEAEITQNQTAYYAKRKGEFYERFGEQIDSIQRISEKHIFMLKEIKRILKKNNTNYKVVLTHLYEQIKYNNADLIFLKNLFGSNLYDFSGKNSYTENQTNYYESSHFKPYIGDSILAIIYK